MNDDAFFKVISDLKQFLPYIVLVGGWVPYVYKNFVWKDVVVSPHHTTDVDFGIGKIGKPIPSKTIYDQLTALKYPERHVRMDRMSPVEPLIKLSSDATPIPLEFICDKDSDLKAVQKLVGRQIKVDQLSYFNVLLSDLCTVSVKREGLSLEIKIPSEPIFVFHKIITFQFRENAAKVAKDLYYAYYVLRFSPNREQIKSAFKRYRRRAEWGLAKTALDVHFKSPTSNGVILIEKEFGPDSILADLRGHIWETFEDL